MKYIIASRENNYPCAVVFDESIIHAYVAIGLVVQHMEIESAGFVYLDCDLWVVSDTQSESLGIGPNKVRDEFILNQFLSNGVTGLDLLNLVTLAELRGTL